MAVLVISADAVPKNISAKNIFKYANGKEAYEPSFINADNITTQPITINKRIIADTTLKQSTQSIWKDGFENPLLIKENIDSVTVYHFYSRFNPQWNNLVWSDAFPSLLLHLIFNDEINNINNNYNDVRVIDAQQIQPVFAGNPNKIVASATEDLLTVFWIMIFLLFLYPEKDFFLVQKQKQSSSMREQAIISSLQKKWKALSTRIACIDGDCFCCCIHHMFTSTLSIFFSLDYSCITCSICVDDDNTSFMAHTTKRCYCLLKQACT